MAFFNCDNWENDDYSVPFSGPMRSGRGAGWRNNNFRRSNFAPSYEDAYGDYQGGYGPGGGYGPTWMTGPNWFGPNFEPGRGYGGMKPRFYGEHPAIKYMLRCGLFMDQVKNLPNELLDLTKPLYCGICAHHFDSFSQSRIHYVSKNHNKRQKRWLTQFSESSGFPADGNELPLKSRDLYCELCDVHITSKAHADSHYSGKSHRSVVEGHKPPKNPMLVQIGMEKRIEHLIRRERKHLKETHDTEMEDSKETDKPLSSDLYCDICKTSVTCTEQMTMHLNGKKHLTREKQHILQMMRDGSEDNEYDYKEGGAYEATGNRDDEPYYEDDQTDEPRESEEKNEEIENVEESAANDYEKDGETWEK